LQREATQAVSKHAQESIEFQNGLDELNSDSATIGREIGRLSSGLQAKTPSGGYQISDPKIRLDMANKIVQLEKQQLQDAAGRANSAQEAAKILRQGIQIPPEVRAVLYEQQLDTGTPEFRNWLYLAANKDSDLTEKLMQQFA